MSKIDEGGFAFPVPNDANVNGDPGMTLRAWLAGQALSGLMGHPQDIGDPVAAADLAVKTADATIKALKAKQEEDEAASK